MIQTEVEPGYYLVPALFWLDHEERQPCDKPEQMAVLLSIQNRQAHIAATPEQLENLRSDAQFYAEGNVDGCASLVRSAKATLAALDRATIA